MNEKDLDATTELISECIVCLSVMYRCLTFFIVGFSMVSIRERWSSAGLLEGMCLSDEEIHKIIAIESVASIREENL